MLVFDFALAVAPEIVVVAERRATDVARTPGSISVLAGDDVARIGPEHPAEALNRVAGVAIHRNNGVESLPAIRSPVFTGGQSAGSFLVLEDGVPIRAPAFGNVNQLFETSLDLADRVEVVRGPGSALYGSNAVHGLVNVVTPRPEDTVGVVRLSADSVGRRTALALTPAGAGYAGISIVHEDGWRASSGLDQQKLVAAWSGEAGGVAIDARLAAQNLHQETAGFIEGRDAYKSSAIARANQTPQAYRDSRLVRAQARLTRDLAPDLTLAVTPFARAIETDLILSFFPSQAQEITRQVGGGAQAALYWDPSPAASFILGVDVDRTRGSLSEVQSLRTIGTFPQGVHYDYEVAATMRAGFAQAAWTFAPAWRAVFGLRAEEARFAYETRTPAGDSGRFRRPADREDRFSYVTPKLSLLRELGEGAAFVNLARGARAPQASDLYSLQTRQAPGEQRVETLDSAELGLRLPFAGRGRVELVGYAMEKRDTAFRGADGLTVTGGRTRHRGIEASAVIPLGRGVEVSGWWTLASHVYRFDSPADGIRSGARIDTAPERQGSAVLTWRPHETRLVELEGVFAGAYFTDAANTRIYSGHRLLNVRFEQSLGPLRIGVAARNLTNEAYAERADFAFGVDRYFPGEPRRVALTLTARR